jgi:phosphopentomutase
MTFSRVLFIVLDACGVGALPDADRYGDAGSSTIPHTADSVGGLALPNLGRLGLSKIVPVKGVKPPKPSDGAFGKMAEKSAGKDSTTGHWEHFGVILEKPFPLYPDGFPEDVIGSFTQKTGYGVLGNKPASGTEIIKELGADHLQSGKLIVYTSADSVFQIAAHEETVSIDELYRICQIAREILTGDHAVGRVIARPFIGKPGNFTRTKRRRDFSLKPPSPTVNQALVANGVNVLSIGKIYDLFDGEGITKSIKAAGNEACMDETRKALDSFTAGLLMVNFVDFDMLWGHRNDVKSFAQGLERFDRGLAGILDNLQKSDLLIITADHGCDPTTPSTDHSREYVPLLVYYPGMPRNIDLGTRSTFADTGKTIADVFRIGGDFPGKSFLPEIISDNRKAE